jgi:DNA-binding NarL/FixJ family response regulator
MSSVPKIAIAPAAASPREPPGPPRHLQIVRPPEPRRDALLHAALDADACSAPLLSLSTVWIDHVQGRLRPCFESMHPDRVLLVMRETSEPFALAAGDTSILEQVFCGVAQKVLSLELGVAVSTLSSRYNRSLAKMGLAPRAVPLPLVLAAQCSAKIAPIASARGASFERHGALYRVVSLPVPVMRNMAGLTHAEQQVARWIIEGCSRGEIGGRRGTSVHTTSRQFHSIFTRLHISGRYALIRRAFELGCFDG